MGFTGIDEAELRGVKQGGGVARTSLILSQHSGVNKCRLAVFGWNVELGNGGEGRGRGALVCGSSTSTTDCDSRCSSFLQQQVQHILPDSVAALLLFF
jgi:hypothetical protein